MNTTEEAAMNDKPYEDPREQSVLAHDPYEQARRMEAIEQIGQLVNEWGSTTVSAWAFATPPDWHIAPLVESFGVDRVGKWIRYFTYAEGLEK